jgi:hypothetical protein
MPLKLSLLSQFGCDMSTDGYQARKHAIDRVTEIQAGIQIQMKTTERNDFIL